MNLSFLKAYALEKRIPIITDEALALIEDVIKKHHVKDVLEIGTAIGYSALAIASFGCHVDTFERDEFMIEEANKHFDRYDEHHQITLFPFDALTYALPLKSYDLIFIDAAKSQYQTFFKKFTPYLKVGGLVICDNLNFHHLDPAKVNRHTQALLRKLEVFKRFLADQPDFQTDFFDLGDGTSLSVRIK
jgi:predicted O-methyltransferase YrrM